MADKDNADEFAGTGDLIRILRSIVIAHKENPQNPALKQLREVVTPLLTPEMCELMLFHNATLEEQNSAYNQTPMQAMMAQMKATPR